MAAVQVSPAAQGVPRRSVLSPARFSPSTTRPDGWLRSGAVRDLSFRTACCSTVRAASLGWVANSLRPHPASRPLLRVAAYLRPGAYRLSRKTKPRSVLWPAPAPSGRYRPRTGGPGSNIFITGSTAGPPDLECGLPYRARVPSPAQPTGEPLLLRAAAQPMASATRASRPCGSGSATPSAVGQWLQGIDRRSFAFYASTITLRILFKQGRSPRAALRIRGNASLA